ncbi:crAss001_48 related protein [Acinetobacter sp. WCHAc060025]|uniref:crAss001_48 related protein n=1 Tax=Acinetobacter sp. WCHAc060025 TaxID=2518625 RepID=UPI001023285F|nr:hypothetical protein [Acinetobacter sp. WCHAc060025]RZG74819.1 hypothetical protein EXE09_12595 [Acinetobacter sp. WCHAc060025]
MNIIEDGESGLPETAQQFKDWYDDNMGWLHTDIINGDKVVLMPAFDFDVDEDEFLNVDLDKAYCVWCGSKKQYEAKASQPKNHIERMQSEKHELDVKLTALNAFLAKLGTDQAPLIDDNQAYLLEEQAKHMKFYSNILGERIKNDAELISAIG